MALVDGLKARESIYPGGQNCPPHSHRQLLEVKKIQNSFQSVSGKGHAEFFAKHLENKRAQLRTHG